MKKTILLIVLASFATTAFAQMGKSYSEVQELYKKKKNTSSLVQQRHFLSEAKEISRNEIRRFLYNSDSLVVGLGIAYKDSSLNEKDLKRLITEEIPQFVAKKSKMRDYTSYQLDSTRNILVMIFSVTEENVFPAKGIFFITDPKFVEAKKNTIWLN